MTRRLLLTRPRAESEGFAARLPQGWQAHIAPMQQMDDLPATPDFTGIDGLVFTSANAVRSFARRWPDIRLPAYCVGDATAAAARMAGLAAQSAKGDARDLAALLAGLPAQNLLYLHGRHVSTPLLVPGHSISAVPIYDQAALALDDETHSMLAAGQIAAVALFSPRSAALLVAARTQWPALACLCLSPAVARVAAPLGPCLIAQTPNAEALLATIGTIDATA